MKEFLKNNKKYFKETAIIIIVGIIINIACFLMPLVVHAANDEGGRLPYNVYVGNQTDNTFFTDQVSSIIHNNTTISAFLSDATTYIIVPWSKNPSNMYFRIIKNPVFDDTIDINTFNYESTSLVVASNSSIYFQMYFYTNGNAPVIAGITQTNSPSNYLILGNSVVSSFVNNTTIRLNYPVELSNNVLKNNDSESILIYGIVTNPTTSEFQNSELTGHATNNTQPTTPTITAPAIDSSLSVIENVKILFNWLGETIKSLLVWLLSSILSFFDNLVTNIKAFIDAVIRAINNGFMNVYNNIQSLFYPFITFFTGYAQGIQDFIDDITDSQTGIIPFLKLQIANIRTGIASLVDDVISIKNFLFGVQGFFDTYGVIWNQETWEDALDSSPWLTAVTDNTTTMSQFINGTLYVAEPQTLEFSFDFRNAHYNFGLCTFNFDWYLPYKNSVRLAFLTICILNAVLYFFDEAPNWFSGGGSNKKGDK